MSYTQNDIDEYLDDLDLDLKRNEEDDELIIEETIEEEKE